MKAAIRDSYVDVVYYMGHNEAYPDWFHEELYDAVFTDEFGTSYWINRWTKKRKISEKIEYERQQVFSYVDKYKEVVLVEDYSIFIKKSNGEIFVTNYDIFDELYTVFRFDRFNNSGLAAFNEDVINYVECHGGIGVTGYPEWFYEFFTESVNNPKHNESIYISDNNGELVVTDHCAVLQNSFGEIMVIDWVKFLEYYDPDPGY